MNAQSLDELARLVPDAQFSKTLQQMTNDQRRAFFDEQKKTMVSTILNDRSSSFQKVATDATRNNAIQNSLFFYMQRNIDLEDVAKKMNTQNMSSLDVATYNSNLATRQAEINEWQFNSKLDTLFVFQILFIMILIVAGLTFLKIKGFYSNWLLSLLSIILIVIVSITIATRALYTTKSRDSRYWNRRRFPRLAPKPGPGPEPCPAPAIQR